MLSPRRLRLLAIAFVGVLATYSGVWMYYIRLQESANARGFDYAYSPSARAVEVRSVRADGAAAKAGLGPGDRIVAIDGVPLDRYRVFLDAFGRRPAGAVLSLEVMRAGGSRRVAI